MEGSELKKMVLEGAMKQDGIDPIIAKWLLKFEEIITKQGAEIEELKIEIEKLWGKNYE